MPSSAGCGTPGCSARKVGDHLEAAPRRLSAPLGGCCSLGGCGARGRVELLGPIDGSLEALRRFDCRLRRGRITRLAGGALVLRPASRLAALREDIAEALSFFDRRPAWPPCVRTSRRRSRSSTGALPARPPGVGPNVFFFPPVPLAARAQPPPGPFVLSVALDLEWPDDLGVAVSEELSSGLCRPVARGDLARP